VWWLLVLLAACGGREVVVRVSIPGLDGASTPLPNLVVAFLPYDRDSVIAMLESRAEPRPHTAELDSLFAAFRTPFGALIAASARLDRLRAAGARAADSLPAAEADVARARAALATARERYWPTMDSLRRDVQRWQNATYAGWDSIIRQLPGRQLANSVADTTDATGWARIELPNGNWWVMARSIDPTDPNAEWYWNLPVTADTLRLDASTGRRQPRY